MKTSKDLFIIRNREREREREESTWGWGEAEVQGERESQVDSPQSIEPDSGLNPTTLRT